VTGVTGEPMSDAEILHRYRGRYPHINLTEAKALRRLDLQFGHLGRTADRLAEARTRNELHDPLLGAHGTTDEGGEGDGREPVL
jgi:hypothetical protein